MVWGLWPVTLPMAAILVTGRAKILAGARIALDGA